MKNGYGLVLAGGGLRGAYEVGAWKALKDLNINITAIVGSSIGAINGALFLQDDYDKIIELYNNIQFKDLAKVSKENKLIEGDILSPNNIINFTKEIAKNKGLENTPMRNLMREYIDVEKVYSSKIEYGIVAAGKNDKESSLEVFKKDINKDDFYDYLLASACLPIFKPQKIGDKEYLDGGMHDNIPINMLLNKNYNNIIAIDITNNGVTKKLLNKEAYIKIIKPNEQLGGILDFDKKRIKKNMTMGYLDTMKAFHKLQGHYYYFKIKEFDKFLDIFNLKTIYGLEHAAKLYGIELYKLYSFDEFFTMLYEKHNEKMNNYNALKEEIKDIGAFIQSKKNIQEILNKGMGLCLFMDIVTYEPKYNKRGFISKVFGDYKEAGEAMVELLNYMRM